MLKILEDHDYASDYEEKFEKFYNSYQTFEKILKSSKELADYYVELDKPTAPPIVDLLSPVLPTERPSPVPVIVPPQQSVPLSSTDKEQHRPAPQLPPPLSTYAERAGLSESSSGTVVK